MLTYYQERFGRASESEERARTRSEERRDHTITDSQQQGINGTFYVKSFTIDTMKFPEIIRLQHVENQRENHYVLEFTPFYREEFSSQYWNFLSFLAIAAPKRT